MESTGFKNSRSKSTLSFNDEELEEKYKRIKSISTQNLFIKFIIILSVKLLGVLLISIYLLLTGNNSRISKALLTLRIYSTPISLLIYLIEYLMMKYNIRRFRGILFILRCFVMMALDPREVGAPRSYGVMWYYSLIIVCGMFISYNWIVASVTTFVGIFTFLIIDAIIHQNFLYCNHRSLVFNLKLPQYKNFIQQSKDNQYIFLIIPKEIIFFGRIDGEQVLYQHIFNQEQILKGSSKISIQKEEQWRNVLEEVPECIIVASEQNTKTLYANPKAISICSDLGIENEFELAEKIRSSGGNAELKKESAEENLGPLVIQRDSTSPDSYFLECGEATSITFKEEECRLYLIKDQTLLKKSTHERLKAEYSNMLLCSLSHELRTPLNGIVGVLEIQQPNLSPEKCIQNAENNEELCLNALRSSKLLWYFVSGILALTQLQAGELKFKYSKVSPLSSLHYCIDLIRKEAESRGVQIIQEYRTEKMLNEVVYIDELKYQIILITLLINAAKYTFQGYIKVNLWIEEQIEKLGDETEIPKIYLMTSVEDTGIGISEEAQLSLFQMFGKLQNKGKDKHNSPIHGVGFGLNISKQLTEAMRGSIHFESQLEIGSKFTYCIPLYQQAKSTDDYPGQLIENPRNISSTEIILHTEMSQRTIPIELSETDTNLLPYTENILHANLTETNQDEEVKLLETEDSHLLLGKNSENRSHKNYSEEVKESLKVLIVDDTSINIFALRMLLSKLNVKSDSAANGLEGVKKVEENNGEYSLIFMDCNMPIMDGFEATSVLKAKMSTEDLLPVPIVALTAYASKKVEEECYLAGMDDIYFKPISLDKVKACLSAFNIQFNAEEL